jgi:5-methylcytosine-specific restriction endonuclease McrA
MSVGRVPKALREQVWKVYNGNTFEKKCWVQWCENLVTPFTFEAGHNIPRSRGGSDDIDNLRPICSNCNRSMGNQWTIDEFSALSSRSANYLERFRFASDPQPKKPRGTQAE